MAQVYTRLKARLTLNSFTKLYLKLTLPPAAESSFSFSLTKHHYILLLCGVTLGFNAFYV